MRLVTASVLGLLGLLLVGPLAAQEPQPVEREREHVVRRGDTLWDLANRYLGNPFVWPRIHSANRQVVADPHWIYPEQVLVIPGLREPFEARPLGERTQPPGEPVAAWRVEEPAVPERTVFYRDPAAATAQPATVLTEPVGGRAPVMPGEFYRAEYLEQPGALAVIGRVLQPVREVDQSGGLVPSAHPRDDLYVAYAGPVAPLVGDRYVVAQVGRRVPGAGLDARLIDPRAIVRVVELEPQTIRVHVEEQFGAVVRDQVMLPLEFYPDFVVMAAEPVPGEHDLQGQILEFVDENPLPGKMSRSFINLGRLHGVQVGDMFEAYLPERRLMVREGFRRVAGELLPEEPVAMMRVIRVTDLGATVVADQVMKPQLEPGLPVRRVRKMP
jgi:hypothetical protein